MRKITLLVTAAAAAMLAGAAFSQPPAGGPGGGGGRGPAQTPEQREAAFTAADANKDGKLDKAEFTKTLPEQMQANADMALMRRDANMDGSISKEEFMAAGGRGGPGGGGRGGPPPAGGVQPVACTRARPERKPRPFSYLPRSTGEDRRQARRGRAASSRRRRKKKQYTKDTKARRKGHEGPRAQAPPPTHISFFVTFAPPS